MYGPTPKISWMSRMAARGGSWGVQIVMLISPPSRGTITVVMFVAWCTAMRLADIDYELPDERIAQHPIEPRDAARLLVDRGSAAPDHRHVRDLPELLGDGDLLVVNDSKVIPARLDL